MPTTARDNGAVAVIIHQKTPSTSPSASPMSAPRSSHWRRTGGLEEMKRIATMLGFPLKSINPSNALVQLQAHLIIAREARLQKCLSAATFVRPRRGGLGNCESPSSVHEAEHAHSGMLSRAHRIAQLAEQDVGAACYERKREGCWRPCMWCGKEDSWSSTV